MQIDKKIRLNFEFIRLVPVLISAALSLALTYDAHDYHDILKKIDELSQPNSHTGQVQCKTILLATDLDDSAIRDSRPYRDSDQVFTLHC